MSKINITGLQDIDDPFYRYKMSKLNIVKLKNKIIIDNIPSVAHDIYRNDLLIVEFIKKKFGISVIYKNKILTTTANLDTNDVQSALNEFIEYMVLCPSCRLPETELYIDKDYGIHCKCCSHRAIINKNNVKSKTVAKLLDIKNT